MGGVERGLEGDCGCEKKMEARGPGGRRRVIRADCRGDLGRTAVGAWGGQPRGHLSGDGAVPTGVVLRLRGPDGCGAVSRVCAAFAGAGRAVERWSGGASGVSGGCGDLCRVAAGASERWRAVSNGRCAVVRSGLQRRAGGCGPGMFPDGGSPGLRGWGGLRKKSGKGSAGAVGSVGSPEQPEQSARLLLCGPGVGCSRAAAE